MLYRASGWYVFGLGLIIRQPALFRRKSGRIVLDREIADVHGDARESRSRTESNIRRIGEAWPKVVR